MWEFILGIGIIFLIIEIFLPTLFFLNFALSAFICAIISLFYSNIYGLLAFFSILAFIFVFTIRPILLKFKNNKKIENGIANNYIGKIAKVLEKVDKNAGIVSIYDERWQARMDSDDTAQEGEYVEIIGHDSLILKVKKQ